MTESVAGGAGDSALEEVVWEHLPSVQPAAVMLCLASSPASELNHIDKHGCILLPFLATQDARSGRVVECRREADKLLVCSSFRWQAQTHVTPPRPPLSDQPGAAEHGELLGSWRCW